MLGGKSSAAVETIDEEEDDLEVDFDDVGEDEDEVESDATRNKVATPRKTVARTKARPAKATSRPGGRPPQRAGSGGGKGRKPTRPIRVNQGRNWGPIMLFTLASLLVLGIIGFGVYALVSRPDPSKWQERADSISGIVDFRKTAPAEVAGRQHVKGVQTYPMSPPVGGNHNAT